MQDWLHDFSFYLKEKKRNEELLKLKAVFVLVKLKGCQEVFGRSKFKIK